MQLYVKIVAVTNFKFTALEIRNGSIMKIPNHSQDNTYIKFFFSFTLKILFHH